MVVAAEAEGIPVMIPAVTAVAPITVASTFRDFMEISFSGKRRRGGMRFPGGNLPEGSRRVNPSSFAVGANATNLQTRSIDVLRYPILWSAQGFADVTQANSYRCFTPPLSRHGGDSAYPSRFPTA
ncbi:hypothetical protein Aut01nite_45840 [Actinoplanes utahensis]|nr:hypothetical protein Aut01nite_45840 [Actinoplanes utahensis]